MALPTNLWLDMNISPHNTRQDYLDNWGDCQDVTQGSVYFYTQHYTANTRQHYSDENPTFQALAAREAALAHKVDQLIDSVDADFLEKDTANDANLWLSKSSTVSIIAETSSGDAYAKLSGTTDSYIDMINSGNTSGYRYFRLRNDSDSFSIQRRSNDGSSLTDTPFHMNFAGQFMVTPGTIYSLASNPDLGTSGYKWRNLYLSGEVEGDLVPNATNTYNLGSFANNWNIAYIRDLNIANEIFGNLVPQTTGVFNIGGSSNYWNNAYIQNLYLSSQVYTDIIPNGSSHSLGDSGNRWSSAYINNLIINNLITGNLMPSSSLIYDIGSYSARWGEAHVTDLRVYGNVQGSLDPDPTDTLNLGTISNRWNNVACRNLLIDNWVQGNLIPSSNNVYQLGESGAIWSILYINNLNIANQITGNLIPSSASTYNLGSPSARWLDMHSYRLYLGELYPTPTFSDIICYGVDFIPSVDSSCRLGDFAHHFFSINVDYYNPFTGSHPIMVSKKEEIEIEEGMVAVSTGKVYIQSLSNVIVQAEPSKKANDPCVYGVFRKPTDDPTEEELKEDSHLMVKLAYKNNYWSVNALGEGQMLVICIDGKEPKNGDLLVTSRIPGYATSQTDDVFKSCTIAKVTQNIDWDKVDTYVKYKNKKYKKSLIAVTYHCG